MIANTLGIGDFDPVVQQALAGELRRQEEHIELIASENCASPSVLRYTAPYSPTSTPRATPASAITAASSWTPSNN